jgi:class 3 adenylate cyclase
MKRSLITPLIIGVSVALGVGALHATRALAGVETVTAQLLSDYAGATRVFSDKGQYPLVLLIALGVAWLSLSNVPRWCSRVLSGIFAMELLGLSWVCSLYRVFFQPAPAVLALAVALAASEGWSLFLRRDRLHLVRALFADRLSQKEFRRLRDGTTPFDAQPRAYQVSVVVCDLANKVAFAQGSEPSAFAEVAAEFIRQSAAGLIKQGAYLQAADAEGVMAFFGFPVPDTEHARKAVRVVLEMIRTFRERAQSNERAPGDWEVRAGISSGTIIAGALQESGRLLLLASGQPIELARRFCALNHRYGSTVLIDTPTFDQVGDAIVARPIDFVSGRNSQDRLEIYEPLWPAEEATPEHVARRDRFWNGVVLYREKRWAEAYAEFQRARGPEMEEDPPLQFYLRQLELRTLSELTGAPPESRSGGF